MGGTAAFGWGLYGPRGTGTACLGPEVGSFHQQRALYLEVGT